MLFMRVTMVRMTRIRVMMMVMMMLNGEDVDDDGNLAGAD